MNPTPWEEIPDVFKYPLGLDGSQYSRTPKKIPRHVVADMLGMSISELRRARKRLNREINLSAENTCYLSRLATAKFKARALNGI